MSTTTDTPTDQPDLPTPTSDNPALAHRPHSWVSLLATLVGAIVIIAIVAQGLVATLLVRGPDYLDNSGPLAGGGDRGDGSSRPGAPSLVESVPVDGVQSLELEVGSAELELEFEDIDQARLEVESRGWHWNQDWSLEVDGNTLIVSQDMWGWSFSGFAGTTEATLVLPQELSGSLDASVWVSAGSIDIDEGSFGNVELEVAAGAISFEAASSSMAVTVLSGEANIITDSVTDLLSVDVASGIATVDVTNAALNTISVEVNAGRADVAIEGAQPSNTTVEVNAGFAEVLLPDGEYALTGEASAGDREINVRSDSSSRFDLDVEVSAGRAVVEYVD
ncbi:MAG: DUF4097 family beta strand repeat-containing protein [Beutenbergiaceae bacterium]